MTGGDNQKPELDALPADGDIQPAQQSFLRRNRAPIAFGAAAAFFGALSAAEFAYGNAYSGFFFAGATALELNAVRASRDRIRRAAAGPAAQPADAGETYPTRRAMIRAYLKADGAPRSAKILRRATVACGSVAMAAYMTGCGAFLTGRTAEAGAALGTKIIVWDFLPILATIAAGKAAARIERRAQVL